MAPQKNGSSPHERVARPPAYRLLMMGSLAIALAAGAAYWFWLRPPGVELPSSPAPTQLFARFVTIEGGVQVKFAGQLQWTTAELRMLLHKGDLVRTGSGAAAELRFFDNTLFQIRPNSLVTIEESFEDPTSKRREVAARIQSGEVNFQAPVRAAPGSTTTISTPTVRTRAADDAAGSINVSASGDSGIRIYRGTAEAQSTSGQQVALGANTAVSVDAKGQLGPKVALPAVPVLLAPPNQAEIAYPDPPKATTLLAWKGVGSAATYRVMVDVTAAFARPLVDRRDWKPTSLELQGLDAGTYYWQVSALDDKGAEGGFTELARFTITRAAAPATPPPPLLSLEPLVVQGNVVQLRGRTDPGATVAIAGQRIDLAPDGSFNEFITLEPDQRELVVRATGPKGGSIEQRRTVVRQ